MRIVRFRDHVAVPRMFKIGVEMDHNAEQIKFELPQFDDDQVAVLYWQTAGYADAEELLDGVLTVGSNMTQHPGIAECYITIAVGTENPTLMWHSQVFEMGIMDLPAIEEQVDLEYPSVIQAGAVRAEVAAELAGDAQTAAETAQSLAETAQGGAEDAQAAAEAAQAAAENAQALAETAKNAAVTHASGALSSANAAQASAADAATQATLAAAEANRAAAAAAGVKTAEAARVTAEEGRVSAESARVSAETARETAETARETAETARESAETARETAETARASAESARVTAEAAREAYVESLETRVVNVEGANPAITGEDNHRYICGEVETISITPPVSGIIDVIFTSGTTAAILTVPNTVKWPGWFDPTSLDTGVTYEINIMDGVYGAVMEWA